MTRRELPLNPYADEPLPLWEQRLKPERSTEQRYRAFNAIASLATADVVCGHAISLCRDADAELRAVAVRWLANSARSDLARDALAAHSSAIAETIAAALTDSDPDVQLEAARGVAALEPNRPQLTDVIVQLIGRQEAQPSAQAALAELCGIVPPDAPRLGAFLLSSLRADAAEVREAAAMALARWGSAAAFAETDLAAALDDEEPLVREHAAVALAHCSVLSAQSREALQHASCDEDAAVASAARRALGSD